jgi:hypothetical protein
LAELDSNRSDSLCVVCGKDTSGGRGFMTLHVGGRPVPICCPMCYKVYEADPARYVTGQRVRDVERSLGGEPLW